MATASFKTLLTVTKRFTIYLLPLLAVMVATTGNSLFSSMLAKAQASEPPKSDTSHATSEPAMASPSPTLDMETTDFPQGKLYVLHVPAGSNYKVLPAVSKALTGVASPVWQAPVEGHKPVFIINGGFFDPANGLTTSYLFKNGVLAADPRKNPNLINNPKLAPYLSKIFNRTEFRSYVCKNTDGSFKTQYDIVPRNAAIPGQCLLQDSLGAGPSLLPEMQDVEEGFVDHDSMGKVIRDPIGVCAQNARSVVGVNDAGDVWIAMGAQKPDQPKAKGFSLPEMARLLKARGATKAMSLDGGSSSGFWYQSKMTYGKFNKEGEPVKRPVKSVLMVVPQ